MRIKKIYFGVFLLTFFIGYASVLPTIKNVALKKAEKVSLQKSNFHNSPEFVSTSSNSNVSVASKPEPAPKFEPEIVIETNFDRTEKYKMNLLQVGDGYREEDVKAKSGEIWMGFYKNGGDYFLRSKKIKVYQTKQKGVRDFSTAVKVSGRAEPIVLIGKAKNLRDGKVKTLFSQSSDEPSFNPQKDNSLLGRGSVKNFKLGERKYSLRVKQAVDQDNDKFLALILESEGKSQVVEYCPYFEKEVMNSEFEDYLGYLVWVGDLDRDGKLDFYLEYNTHERGDGKILYLSSEAEKGKLIGVAAVYSPTGC